MDAAKPFNFLHRLSVGDDRPSLCERGEQVSDVDKDTPKASDDEEQSPETKRPARRRFGVRYLIIGLVVIIGGIFAFREVHQRLIYVYEYDARIAGDMVTVSSRVAGWVTKLPVSEGELIAGDQMLVKIDSLRDFFP